jgi:hypothetical protein
MLSHDEDGTQRRHILLEPGTTGVMGEDWEGRQDREVTTALGNRFQIPRNRNQPRIT